MIGNGIVLLEPELNGNFEILVGGVGLVEFLLVIKLGFKVVALEVGEWGREVDGDAKNQEQKSAYESKDGGGGAP